MIKVEGTAGDSVEDCVKDLVETSRRLNLGVKLDFNGVSMWTWPHMTEKDVLKHFELERSYNK
jgi:hypothetical protein